MTEEEVELIEELIRAVIDDTKSNAGLSDLGEYLRIDRIKSQLIHGKNSPDQSNLGTSK